jgi:PEP-CTERM motif
MIVKNMRNLTLVVGIVGVTGMSSSSWAQTPIAWWNFNSGAAVPTTIDATVRANQFSADGGANVGTATMTTNLSISSTGAPLAALSYSDGTTGSARGISTFTGSAVNVQGSPVDVNGSDLAITTGDATSTTPTLGTNNGAQLIFGASTVGFDTISVSWANRITSTGFQASQFAYSADGGGSWLDFEPTFGGTTTYTLKTVNLNAITAINNNANTLFRITFNGGSTTAATGNARLDNLLISGNTAAIPEPTTLALLSLGVVGLVARRRKK